MGFDQYAYIKTTESGDEGETPKFVWRSSSVKGLIQWINPSAER